MATTAKKIEVKAGIVMGSGELATYNSGNSVDVSIVSDTRWNTRSALYCDFKMELRREIQDVGPRVIGTRTGYVTETSAAHRTFTNVGPGVLNVKVTFYARGDLGGKVTATHITKNFKH